MTGTLTVTIELTPRPWFAAVRAAMLLWARLGLPLTYQTIYRMVERGHELRVVPNPPPISPPPPPGR